MQKTSIQWCDASANPIRARHKATGKVGWHCVMHSAGCARCYAQTLNKRFGTGLDFNRAASDQVEVFLDEKVLRALLKVRKPQRIFLCDMTDLFGNFVPDAMLDTISATMAGCPHLTFQLLTKRPERMQAYCSQRYLPGRLNDARILRNLPIDPIATWPLPNVWLGTSVEDQKTADQRSPRLCWTDAAVHFLSVEPLLEPVILDLTGIEWCIIGAESGPGARPFHVDWARSLIRQCREASVPIFMKQVGPHPQWSEADLWAGQADRRLKDRKGGDPAEWPSDLRIREFPSGGS